ncbi:hypothetical protein [uncultured Methanobrevibacter sp.]|uniref:hypothetical protein n=1 Tax=uncultured Methanobrevibacter sp. TaxID=253161 RepID=UPI00345C91B1
MYISRNSLEVIIKNSLFIQNKANEGGAIYGGNGKIYNCINIVMLTFLKLHI